MREAERQDERKPAPATASPTPRGAGHETILQMQRTAGNQAVARTLGGPDPRLVRVLARANLRWTPGPKPVIVTIDFGKRSGKQDDHTTAFVAFQEAVRQNLVGRSLKDAVIQLYLLVNEMTELEGYRDATAALGREVTGLLATLMNLIELAESDALYVSGELGAAIDDYLRLRNRVPGTKEPRSAVVRGSGGPPPGKLEKEGRKALDDAIKKLSGGKGKFADVEELLAHALAKLHDYVTTRKTMPTLDEFARIVAQHYQSIMQVSPELQHVAEELFDAWIAMVKSTWGANLTIDDTFVAGIRYACSLYVKPPAGKKRKGEFVDDPSDRPLKFRRDDNPDADDGHRLEPDDSDELPKSASGSAQIYDSRKLDRWQTVSYLNRMAEQGLIRAAELIEFLIAHPELQDEILDDLDLRFAVTPEGRVYFKLRGG